MSNLPAIIQERGILPEVFSALKNSIFPGASDESVVMAWDYCAARQLDVMLKPVHLVPMYIKDKQNGDRGAMRDVVMPGIGLYRIQADRAGNYAGMSAPVFGPDLTQNLQGTEVTFPEWCEITVSKLMGERLVSFTAREYWIENYATAGRETKAPNAMWQKRPRGQLVKCTEAQALRKGWPELGAQPTAEEMEGKEIDITPISTNKPASVKQDSVIEALSNSDILRLKNAIKIAGISEEEFCKNKKINVSSVESLPSAKLEGALAMLKKFAEQ
jgi:phage recombination protein Bet